MEEFGSHLFIVIIVVLIVKSTYYCTTLVSVLLMILVALVSVSGDLGVLGAESARNCHQAEHAVRFVPPSIRVMMSRRLGDSSHGRSLNKNSPLILFGEAMTMLSL